MVLCLAMVATLCTVFVGCRNTGENVDPTKTQIYVTGYDGGNGKAFMESWAAKFTELNKDKSFEPGKTGVQIFVGVSTTVTGDSFKTQVRSNFNDIFFTEDINYYEYMNQNALLDITDIVTTPLSEYGETKSIEDKLYPVTKDFFKTSADKYYGLPLFEPYTGFVYDIDVFDDYGFYIGRNFDAAKNTGYVFADELKSAGPDGTFDTWDDGFPATYDEFFKLLEYIKKENVTPLIWTGQHQAYSNWNATSLWVDYEGEEQMRLNFTFDGTATSLVTANDDGTTTPIADTPISAANATELAKQAGRYEAIDFMRRLVKSGNYHKDSFSPMLSHTGAQREFLYSKRNTSIAIMLESSWWENEATGVFTEMAKNNPNDAKLKRNLGFMPLPKANAAKVEEARLSVAAGGKSQTVFARGEAMGFIKSNVPANRLEAVKAFFRFCHTDAMLVDFSQVTNMSLMFDYDLTAEQQAGMTTFGRSLLEHKANSNVIFGSANSDIYHKNAGDLLNSRNLWFSTVSSQNYKFISNYYKDNSTAGTKAYFDGIAAYYATNLK